MTPIYALIEYKKGRHYGQVFMIMNKELQDELMKAFKSGTKFLGHIIVNVGIYTDPEYYFKELIPAAHEKTG